MLPHYLSHMALARVKQGDRVLVLGATGGVGVCCVQIAKLCGAEVAACTSSNIKAEMLKSIGADHVINVKQEDYVEAIHKLWGKPRVFDEGGGADLLINYVGGEDWPKSLKCIKRGGKMLTCGATNGFNPKTDIRYIWSFELSLMGSNSWTNQDLVDLLNMVAESDINPVKHSVRPLEELAVSFQELIDREVFGKAVLTI
jgi:alcohol dehydrogenase